MLDSRTGRGADRPAPQEISLQPPPGTPIADAAGGGSGGQLMMVPMMLGMGAMGFSSLASRGGPMLIVFGVLFGGVLVGMLVMMLGRGRRARTAGLNVERRTYMRHLQQVRVQVRDVARRQREVSTTLNPDPSTLVATARQARLWDRGRGHPQFGHVRVATGPQRLACRLVVPETAPLEDLDPLCASALRRLLRTSTSVGDLPVALALPTLPRLGLSGDREAVAALTRAFVAQLVTFHSPDDVRLALCIAPERASAWGWAAWLPHLLHPTEVDAAGPVRQCSTTLGGVERLLGDQLGERQRFSLTTPPPTDRPHLVVIVDGGDPEGAVALADESGLSGVTVVNVGSSRSLGAHGVQLVVEQGRLGRVTPGGVALVGEVDGLGRGTAATLARSLTRLHQTRRRAATPSVIAPLSGDLGLPDLLGFGELDALDIPTTQRSRLGAQRLRIPFGVDADGQPVELDLKESAEGGMGPHGLVIGATGSGKSELLRTIVLGLAATHTSETLNLVLVDFKGGATFAGLGGLPHTAAVITNLADDDGLVDRMRDALAGELVRRQEVLRDAGNFASVRDYERARAAGADLDPLPSLLVIIDEFSEMLSAQPDFIDLFVMIGRLGRSLGVHLMLASQRLEEGRLRGLDSHLSYRIGLRTFSTGESRSVLGVPDAATLPSVPGSGFLKVDSDTLIRFKAAYVSGPVARRTVPLARRPVAGTAGDDSGPWRIRPFSLAPQPLPAPRHPQSLPEDPRERTEVARAGVLSETPADAFAESVTDVLVQLLEPHGVPAHRVWLPPLTEAPALSALLPPLAATEERGLCPAGWAGNGQLSVPVALVDRPYQQRQDLSWVHLSEAAGHVAVVGGPRSGKSTWVRTLVLSLALTHTPREVQVYGLDLAGATLSPLTGLPHVGGVAGRLQTDRASRLVAEVVAAVGEREQLFVDEGIDSIAEFRRRRAAGERLGARDFGDVFLVVDGWLTLRDDFPDLYDRVVTLVSRGLTYGVHVVMTAQRWMEIRPQVKDLVGSRVELRLGDPLDSEFGRKAAALVPEGAPGRGMNAEKLHLLTALPRVDDATGPEGAAAAMQDAVERVSGAWRGSPAPPVRMLPATVSTADLDTAVEQSGAQPSALLLPLGIGERDLGALLLDFAAEPHLTVIGDQGSGKTALLRELALRLTDLASPSEAKLVVIDYRRGLLGELPDSHLVGLAGSARQAGEVVDRVRVTLEGRIPGPDVTPTELKQRSWWTGPELFVLVDDYDLVATGQSDPLPTLAEFLPQARDLGLHVIVTRRSAGAGRSSFGGLLPQLADAGGAGLLLSGTADEGAVFSGVRMSPRIPGRGTLVRRSSAPGLVQLAWREPR
ncbi:MAG: type secretion protein EccC [Actinomycetota bacterium]